jgi:hypothetical protein
MIEIMSDTMTNAQIAELLAVESETAEGNKLKALRRASRLPYAWPVEASELLHAGRSVTELPGVGPWIAGRIASLAEDTPEAPAPPAIRDGFMPFADARAALASDDSWSRALKGDLQMHTVYSDGRETIEDMARAGMDLGYEYVAVTDHSKGLRIAGGIDEETLSGQIREVDELNDSLASEGRRFRVLRSLEMNLKPDGIGDMDPEALSRLDLVLGSFHSSLRVKEDQTDRYLAALENPDIDVLGHPRGRIYNFRVGLKRIGRWSSRGRRKSGRRSRSTAIPIGRTSTSVSCVSLGTPAPWCPSKRTPTTRWRCSSCRLGSPPRSTQGYPRSAS